MPKGGFSFCDTNIGSLGLYYVPELEDTFVYKPAEAVLHVETFDSHNGGYTYGAWIAPKDFVLRCYFEDAKIEKGIMAQVYSLFKVGKSGKLIFDRRPWCYYHATVTDPVETNFTNYENGVITIRMKAMYPFARSDIMTSSRTEKYHDALMSNSSVFDKEGMELPDTYHMEQQTSLVLANPGTERAALGFAISGNVGSGIILTNNTTGQKCKMVAITKEKTTSVNKKVLVDPISGKTVLIGEGTKELAFIYHQYGFLSLESSFPAVRNLYVNYVNGTTVNVSNILAQNLVGKYIFILDRWHKITDQPDKHTLTVDGEIQESGSERTMAIPMNEIVITPVTTMDIDIQFIFKPTYA